ncbi:MAG: 4Fe-4S dicluster domain-containing protein [Gammaproteobacteria bacterium]|nr:4Fe-4S dicluster domain-containing protein [Gammaproteobacteria bacterium]
MTQTHVSAATTPRQLAMVMDLNKCIGCQTCTVACKMLWTGHGGREHMYWNNVETQPGQGYPRGYAAMGGGIDSGGDPRLGDLPAAEDYGIPWEYDPQQALFEPGDSPWLRPHVEPTSGPNWDEDRGSGDFPNTYYFYLPRMCNHCSDPPCLKACPAKAVYKRGQDGIVLIDQSKCQGFQMCVRACPYKKSYFNAATGRSEKCIFCYPRVEKGVPPACAAQCVGRIRHVGYRDDHDGPVWKLVDQYKVALPLHPEWATQPNVFYVPPTAPPAFAADGRTAGERIPRAFLESLFGPGVHQALATLQTEREKKARGVASELMDTLIGFRHAEMFKLA